MTSFFQPASNDPTILECGHSTFDVYCNSILAADRRLRTHYQTTNLVLGSVALGAPLLVWLFFFVTRGGLLQLVRRLCRYRSLRTNGDPARRSKLYDGISSATSLTTRSTEPSKHYSDSDSCLSERDQRRYDLVLLPLAFGTGDEDDRRSRLTLVAPTPKKRLACADLEALASDGLGNARLTQTAEALAAACFDSNLAGLALRYTASTPPRQFEKLMERLQAKEISVLPLFHHDSHALLDSVNLAHASGVIVENACILPSGERRDYFQADGLRDIMVRCAKERERRPEFFVGFLECWEHRPRPSIIRRAVKLAEHFGAVVEHGPSNPAMEAETISVSAHRTLSAFEYLKQADLTELQKCWASELRKVWIPDDKPAPKMTPLPLNGLEPVIPHASKLLHHEHLPPALSALQKELPTYFEPPEYGLLAPKRKEFWTTSRDGTALSAYGCYSICAEPSPDDFAAVVETQEHLRELDMLHHVKGAEAFQLLKAIRVLAKQSDCRHLIQELLDGLESHQIVIYKGLDTGFGVPEGDAYFWGVSKARGSEAGTSVDIFISQKAPNDATTVLHTWLAHKGTPRDLRYDLESMLEMFSGLRTAGGGDLPLSIKAGIERATTAEVLQLLQQIQVARLDDSLREPVVGFCRSVLIDQSSTSSRRQKYGRKLLDGSMTMREALNTRLEHLVRCGATHLPSLENLLELHQLVDKAIHDSLFFGEKAPLNKFTQTLLRAFDPLSSSSPYRHVDVNADLFALIFFSVLRRAAFEDVYIEATDRCPLFLQPDQAAVFAELWVLGSQCESYFGILPRDLGEVIYDRYAVFLKHNAPLATDRKGNEIMTMYCNSETATQAKDPKRNDGKGSVVRASTMHERLGVWKTRLAQFGAMSIFCLPAILDVVLLTFLGRGMFMTAFMHQDHLRAAVYALLTSLLLSAGIVGWVGSTGNYYLANYAYDNMIYFHVQRLSGGFVLSFAVGACGLIAFGLRYSVAVGFIFVAFLIGITTYLNLLGIMATMHQQKSPLTSGRTVIWRNMPLLLLSPLISSFVNGHDLQIYLTAIYCFLLLLLFQYRRLCHEWSGWMRNIPNVSEKDLLDWYLAKASNEDGEEEEAQNLSKDAQEALREAVSSYRRRDRKAVSSGIMADAFVERVAKGVPYIDWLFKKTIPDGSSLPPPFSSGWFSQLGDTKKQQEQLARGLKEHNILMLFRMARYDIGQNLGLFLVALMDRWVSVVMEARLPHSSMYTDSRARYGICFCILYFSFSVMVLDLVLQKYWSLRFTSSKESLIDHHHARRVAKQWDSMRREALLRAMIDLFSKITIIFGGATLLLWLFVESAETMTLYYLYILGYTSVIIFQFNRCFTTNVRAHVIIIFASAITGFLLGCVLHAVPSTAGWLYTDIVAQNCAAVLAAVGTFVWCWSDLSTPNNTMSTTHTAGAATRETGPSIWAQRRLSAEVDAESRVSLAKKVRRIDGLTIQHEDGSTIGQIITELLLKSRGQPNIAAMEASWSMELIDAAIRMWEVRRIKVVAVNRESFSQDGLSDICSLAQIEEGGVITIKLGLFGETELRSISWHPLLATVAAESVLYHIARIELLQTHSQAVQAEHLLHGTMALSKRLEVELALGDGRNMKRVMRKTNSELMRHLCWNVNVDSSWESIPLSVREAIFCRISGEDVAFSEELYQWVSDSGIDLQNMEFHLRLCLNIFRNCEERYMSTVFFTHDNHVDVVEPAAELKPARIHELRGAGGFLQYMARVPIAAPLAIVKWIAVISGGGANIERELSYCLRKVYFGDLILRATLLLWRMCRFVKDFWVYTLLVYHRHALVNITRLAQKGERRKITKSSIVVNLSRKSVTAFATNGDDDDDYGPMTIEAFDGLLKAPPDGKRPVFKASYDEKFRLISRTDEEGDVSTYNYNPQARTRKRWPLSKEVVGPKYQTIGFYDNYGRITNGILALSDSLRVTFCYHYKATPKGNASVLRADFTPVDSASEDKLSVFWGAPPSTGADDCDWVPSEKVCRIVRVIDGRTFVTEFEHHHRRDPVGMTILDEGDNLKTAMAEAPKVFFEDDVLLVKPRNLSIDSDDVLIHHSTAQVKRMRHYASNRLPIASRWNPLHLWGRRVHIPVPTWRVRTELWSSWLKGSLDAATVCWMDELILREEPLLRQYWRARESGQLDDARLALDKNIDQIVSSIELESDISELCLLPIRTSDLYAMGLGKDATQVTNRPQDCFNDTRDRVSVIFNDIGCWPEAPGGVSNCRRDLVNGHSTIRNHVMAECANDFGIPRFQVEKNVQSLKLLPLWGLDGKTAYHGLIDNILQSQVDEKIRDTDTQRDIVGVFIPLLKDFVKGARTKNYSRADLIKYTNVFLSMSKYYEHKDYNRTWGSKAVENAWAEAWLVPYNDPNITDPSQHYDIQRPSMTDFQDALGIYLAYFFIFAVKIPDECPRVFQSTHHGISSLFGMILKYRRGVTFGIWDHAILWRESCLNISPAQCELSIPVQSMLLSGMRLASRLAYFHADVVMPCTSLFNPMWETEIGTDRGKLCSKNQFRRKIDPIVNGISNMDSFSPVDKIRTDKPTVVMLSNVQFIKGIKPAILAADIIVNRYGFQDYKLLIYGAKDRQPSYALEMAKLIVKCNLSDNVVLAGFGKPKEVLQDAWLFVNSSISEGLPLAIGEAALAGVPIVATEVGATALVVTDPNDQDQRYGEVVAPNDPVALARAQLSLLCMVGPWAKFTEDSEKDSVGTLPDEITPDDVDWLSQRMYDKSDDRRRLGLLSREVVLHSFHGRRYLREHEQMYWIQWHLSKMRADVSLGAGSKNVYKFGSLPPLRYTERETDEAYREEEEEEEAQEAAAAMAAATAAAAAAARNAETKRRKLAASPTSTLDAEAQDAQTADLRSGLAKLLPNPNLLRAHKDHHSQSDPYSLGGSTAASSFSNWAPG